MSTFSLHIFANTKTSFLYVYIKRAYFRNYGDNMFSNRCYVTGFDIFFLKNLHMERLKSENAKVQQKCKATDKKRPNRVTECILAKAVWPRIFCRMLWSKVPPSEDLCLGSEEGSSGRWVAPVSCFWFCCCSSRVAVLAHQQHCCCSRVAVAARSASSRSSSSQLTHAFEQQLRLEKIPRSSR